MRFVFVVVLCLCLIPVMAQDEGVVITCEDGTSFNNGVIFELRDFPDGSSYIATAIGIAGFDPVVAVLNAEGDAICNTQAVAAVDYAADLPTTGEIQPQEFSAQVEFNHVSGESTRLVVGGRSSGEFLLIIEGLAITTDKPVNQFSIQITPELIVSPIPITAYMISAAGALNPEIRVNDSVFCDDPGSVNCSQENEPLVGRSITRSEGRVLRGGQFDSLLQITPEFYSEFDVLTFNMTSYARETTGEYIAAFHAYAGEGGVVEVATPDAVATTGQGISITCPDGTTFDNGVEFVVNQMRPDFFYTATVIGINGFNPVLALIDEDGAATCANDSEEAAVFTADLPSTGLVPSASINAQLEFDQDRGSAADVSLVVGGYENANGEFLMIFEGMALTEQEEIGDAFSVRVTPGLLESDIPITVYMMSIASGFDALLYLADEDLNVILDADGVPVECDDSGSRGCWGNSVQLTESVVSRTLNRTLIADTFDAMLQIPLSEFATDREFLVFVMSSFNRITNGDYVTVFHTETR